MDVPCNGTDYQGKHGGGPVKLSRSTAHMLNRPAVIALALAALRLKLHLPAAMATPKAEFDRQLKFEVPKESPVCAP